MEQRAGLSGKALGDGRAASHGSGYVGHWCLVAALVLGMASSACRQPAPPPSDEWGPTELVPSNPTTSNPTTSNPTTSNPTTSNPTTSNPATSNSATNNPSPTPGAAGNAPSASPPEPLGVVVQAAPTVREAPAPTDEAVIDVGGQPTRITHDTVLAIRTALLAEIEKSKLLHKQELLEQTRDTTISFGPNFARFGLWILSAQGDSLQLIFRQPSDAPIVPFYHAEVLHQAGQWQVENLQLRSMRRAR